MDNITAVSVYRHFKGGYYIVHSVASVESTGEQVVIYQSLQDGRVWTRPVSSFLETVPADKPNPTGQAHRFERVNDFNNQLNLIPTETLLKELLSRGDCPVEIQTALNSDRIWRTEYLIGQFKEVYIDQERTYEDFYFTKCADTLEEAKEKLESLGDPRLSILMRTHIKQDF